jgi:hypothetical protein
MSPVVIVGNLGGLASPDEPQEWDFTAHFNGGAYRCLQTVGLPEDFSLVYIVDELNLGRAGITPEASDENLLYKGTRAACFSKQVADIWLDQALGRKQRREAQRLGHDGQTFDPDTKKLGSLVAPSL